MGCENSEVDVPRVTNLPFYHEKICEGLILAGLPPRKIAFRFSGLLSLEKQATKVCNGVLQRMTDNEHNEEEGDRFDDVSNDSGVGCQTRSSTDLKIHTSTDGYYFEESDSVPLYLPVTNPEDSDTTQFHISGELQRVIDENGEEIPEDERDDPLMFAGVKTAPTGVRCHKTSEETPMQFDPPQPGAYRLRLELKHKPEGVGEPGDIEYEIAIDQEPVRDEAKHMFYVGDI